MWPSVCPSYGQSQVATTHELHCLMCTYTQLACWQVCLL
jgi:hypothetical protein